MVCCIPRCSRNLRRFSKGEAWSLCPMFRNTEKRNMNRKRRSDAGCGLRPRAELHPRRTRRTPLRLTLPTSSHSRNGKPIWSTISNRNGCRWPDCSGSSPAKTALARDPKNAIVFPKGPAHAGSFILQGKTVTAQVCSRMLTQSLRANPLPRPSFSRIRQAIPRSSSWETCGFM